MGSSIEDKEFEAKAHSTLRSRIVGYKPTLEKDRNEGIKKQISMSVKEIDSRNLENVIRTASDYRDAGNSILEFGSNNSNIERIRQAKREIILNALEIIYEKVGCQAASLFVFSKDGFLERIGLYGLGQDGKRIDDEEWFIDETYEANSSLVSRAVVPTENSQYGQIKCASNLSELELDEVSEQKYERKFGRFKAAVIIPLNGRNKTYGALQVLGKTPDFPEGDIRWLISLAEYTATALSNFRRDIQTEILIYLGHLLISAKRDTENIYKEIADLLALNPETSFKVCILRVMGEYDNSLFPVKGISPCYKVTKGRDNRIVGRGGPGLAEKAISTGRKIIIQDIRDQKHIQKFSPNNRDWIIDNELNSFACFPLVAKDRIVGTISLYTGFNYDFYPDSVRFVQSVADLVASFIYRIKQDRYLRSAKRALHADDVSHKSRSETDSLKHLYRNKNRKNKISSISRAHEQYSSFWKMRKARPLYYLRKGNFNPAEQDAIFHRILTVGLAWLSVALLPRRYDMPMSTTYWLLFALIMYFMSEVLYFILHHQLTKRIHEESRK